MLSKFYDYVGSDLQRVLHWRIIVLFLDAFFRTLCSVYTIIYAYNKFTTTDESIIVLVGSILGIVTLMYVKQDAIRGWVVHHTWTVVIMTFIVDGLTEYFILVNPLVKFVGDAIALYLWFEIWSIQIEERIQAILNHDAKRRIQFSINKSIARRIGVGLGAIVVLIFPTMPIEPVVYFSMTTCWLTTFLGGTTFKCADIYMARHNIRYPYMDKLSDK